MWPSLPNPPAPAFPVLDLRALWTVHSLDSLPSQISIILSASLRGKEYFVTVAKVPGLALFLGHMPFMGSGMDSTPPKQRAEECWFPKVNESGHTPIRQARKALLSFCSLAVEKEKHSLTLGFR